MYITQLSYNKPNQLQLESGTGSEFAVEHS